MSEVPLIGILFFSKSAGRQSLRQSTVADHQPTGSRIGSMAPIEKSRFATTEQLQTLAGDVAKLKGIVDGLGAALDGVAKAQARHERSLAELDARSKSKTKARGGKELT
jgi:hypothetical protein